MTTCSYRAPLFAIVTGQKARVTQGCCNHWDCPRCGEIRAREEYGRIVSGCRELAANRNIWFLTITCKGADLSLEEAEEHYLEWTHRFLDNARKRCKAEAQDWHYVQVTERQKRAFPHSHILTTFPVSDAYLDWKPDWVTRPDGKRYNEWKSALRSDWMAKAVRLAGLGEQYDISVVDNVEAASRYVAKYLFKETLLTTWPKGWKRVRYSQGWPKLPKLKTEAIVLINDGAIANLAYQMHTLVVADVDTFRIVERAISKTLPECNPAKLILAGD